MKLLQVKIIKTFLLYLFTLNVVFADDHCDNREAYPNINPSLVLCTIHAYNANHDTNPESLEEIEKTRRIIAMKTTVMTQQMKKQYDFLESTLKRFKIQLEKSILLNNMQANGAIAESDSNKAISGVEKCRLTTDTDDTIRCIQNNLKKAEDFIDNGKVQEAKRILRQDEKSFIGLSNSFDIKENIKEECKYNTKSEIETCITYIKSTLIKIKRTENQKPYNIGLQKTQL